MVSEPPASVTILLVGIPWWLAPTAPHKPVNREKAIMALKHEPSANAAYAVGIFPSLTPPVVAGHATSGTTGNAYGHGQGGGGTKGDSELTSLFFGGLEVPVDWMWIREVEATVVPAAQVVEWCCFQWPT